MRRTRRWHGRALRGWNTACTKVCCEIKRLWRLRLGGSSEPPGIET